MVRGNLHDFFSPSRLTAVAPDALTPEEQERVPLSGESISSPSCVEEVGDTDARMEISWMSQRPGCPPEEKKLENENESDKISFQTAAGKLFAELAWKKSDPESNQAEMLRITNSQGGSYANTASGLETIKQKPSPSQEEVLDKIAARDQYERANNSNTYSAEESPSCFLRKRRRKHRIGSADAAGDPTDDSYGPISHLLNKLESKEALPDLAGSDSEAKINSGAEAHRENQSSEHPTPSFPLETRESNLEEKQTTNTPPKRMVQAPEVQDGDDWDLDNMADFIFTPEKKPRDAAGSIPVEVRRARNTIYRGPYLVKDISYCRAHDGFAEKRLMVNVAHDENSPALTISLCNDWEETPVQIGDIVEVIGDCAPCTLDSSRGNSFLVLNPFLHVGVSKVAQSGSCLRRVALEDRLKFLLGTPTSKPMLLGTLVHELFQTIASRTGASKATGDGWDQKRASEINRLFNDKVLAVEAALIIRQHALDVALSGATIPELVELIKGHFAGLRSFANKFLGGGGDEIYYSGEGIWRKKTKTKISEVKDIEDMVSSDRLGLRGYIDATVMLDYQIREDSSQTSGTRQSQGHSWRRVLAPLEVKSGSRRGRAEIHHQTQVLLYSLLMADLQRNTEDDTYNPAVAATRAMILYTNDGELVGVAPNPGMLISLMQQRNMATAALLQPRADSLPLPLPVEDPNKSLVCKYCDVASCCFQLHAAVSLSVKEPVQGQLAHDFPAEMLEHIKHLNGKDLTFLNNWESIIANEEEVIRNERYKPMVNNKRDAQILKNLTLADWHEVSDTANHGKASVVEFQIPAGMDGSHFLYLRGDKVRIIPEPDDSSAARESRTSSVDGEVVKKSAETISISVSDISKLVECGPGLENSSPTDSKRSRFQTRRKLSTKFQLRRETNSLGSFGMKIMRANIFELMNDEANSRRWRELIIENRPPKFDEKECEILTPIKKVLNNEQQAAVRMSMRARDYVLIEGLPGTGKTQLIASLALTLCNEGKRVLLASHTHSAVDNALLRMKSIMEDSSYKGEAQLIRLAREKDKVMNKIKEHVCTHEDVAQCAADAIKRDRSPTPSYLAKNMLKESTVVACTTMSLGHPLIFLARSTMHESHHLFDTVILDEASQLALPYNILPLLLSRRAILVGDSNQLPPLMKHNQTKNGENLSLFSTLCRSHPESLIRLSKQYRMNDNIQNLANTLIYDGKLLSGSESVSSARLKISEHALSIIKENYTMNFLKILQEDPIVLVKTPVTSSQHSELEVCVTTTVVQMLKSLGLCSLLVIAPTRWQVSQMENKIADNEIEILTIDRAQGRDADIVVMTMGVQENCCSVKGLLGDYRRLNVALTRAKRKLIIIGSIGKEHEIAFAPLVVRLVKMVESVVSLSKEDVR